MGIVSKVGFTFLYAMTEHLLFQLRYTISQSILYHASDTCVEVLHASA